MRLNQRLKFLLKRVPSNKREKYGHQSPKHCHCWFSLPQLSEDHASTKTQTQGPFWTSQQLDFAMMWSCLLATVGQLSLLTCCSIGHVCTHCIFWRTSVPQNHPSSSTSSDTVPRWIEPSLQLASGPRNGAGGHGVSGQWSCKLTHWHSQRHCFHLSIVSPLHHSHPLVQSRKNAKLNGACEQKIGNGHASNKRFQIFHSVCQIVLATCLLFQVVSKCRGFWWRKWQSWIQKPECSAVSQTHHISHLFVLKQFVQTPLLICHADPLNKIKKGFQLTDLLY